jgi:crotonobetainyl-CoA:carnitine CoA-transferase CaiB-like acyl-CoA transferase
MVSLPLSGIRVLDLSNVLSGPFCTYQLALLGADVLKIENPTGGDLARRLGADPQASARNMGASFVAVNAGKESLTLNLKHEAGKEILRKLAADADVLVENFRPGVMDRLGLGAKSLLEVNPRLVYCAISGFGNDGPLAHRPAYDQIIQGMSGAMSVTGDAESAPLRVGYPVADTVGGGRRATHGRGQDHRCLDAGGDALQHGLGSVKLSECRRDAHANGQRKLHRSPVWNLCLRRRHAQYRRERDQAVRCVMRTDWPS